MMTHDAIIVGAGPAGCAAAYDLVRAGRHVVMLDTRSFPRHKACACGLTRKTLNALRYSVEPVIERVCREIVLQQSAVETQHREVRVKTRTPICAMAVRETFDDFCVKQTLAAAENGGNIVLRKIGSIAALRELPTHVALTIRTEQGEETLLAPVLIGADGSNGQVRRLAGGDAFAAERAADIARHDGFALEATVLYASLPARLPQGDAPHDLVFDFAPIAGGYGWLFPKGNHINIGIGAFAPASRESGDGALRLKAVTRSLLADYTRQKLGIDIATLDRAMTRITGQHLGMGGHAYAPRGRVLLSGDAAGLVDPLTGEGIHSAIVSGQAAAAAILEDADDLAVAYARHLAPLQQALAFSHRAARAFYAAPERGFRVMRTPFVRGLVLKTYADGLPHTKLLGMLARLVA